MNESVRGQLASIPFASRTGKRVEPPCPCRCGTRGLCDSHRARLAEIKEELKSGNSQRRVPRKGWNAKTIPGTQGVRCEHKENA